MSQINIGAIFEALNNKTDRDFQNSDMIDYVVAYQTPTVDNDYTWYRLYKSGWIEQGQNYANLASNGQTFTIPIEMKDNRYNIQCTGVSGTNKTSSTVGVFVSTYDTRTTTTFSCYSGDDTSFNNCYFSWIVSGFIKN